jgi:hypothetical protein
VADLEADVEPPEEEEMEEFEELPTPFADAEEGADLDQSGETGVSSDDAVDSSNGGEGNFTDDSTNQQTPGRERPRDTLFMPMQLDNLDRTANITDDELAGLAGTITLEPPTPIEPTERSPFAEASSSMTPPLAISSSASKNRAPPPPDLISARSATPTSTTPFALAASIISEGPLTPRNNAGPYVLDGAAGRERGPMDSLAGTILSQHGEPELEQAGRTWGDEWCGVMYITPRPRELVAKMNVTVFRRLALLSLAWQAAVWLPCGVATFSISSLLGVCLTVTSVFILGSMLLTFSWNRKRRMSEEVLCCAVFSGGCITFSASVFFFCFDNGWSFFQSMTVGQSFFLLWWTIIFGLCRVSGICV